MSLYSSENIVVDREADGSYSLRIEVPGRGVNVITRQLLADLDGALDILTRQERLPVVVIRSGKKSGFLAGADLHEFARIRDLPAALALSETGQRLFSRLSSLAAPTIAVIHGPCLGGGLDWAPHRGGPLRYADDRGLADIVRSLDALTARLGPRFAPCEGLRRRATKGERFRAAL